MSRICVEPLTDDPDGVRAITDYWAQTDDLHFTHKVGAVAAVLGVRDRDVARLVTQFSRAFVAEWPCGGCGGVRPLTSRAEYTRARPGRFAWYCRSCAERLTAEADAARRAKVPEHFPGPLSDPPHPPGLVDRVYLLSLATVGEGAAPVGPLADANPPLSPTAYKDYRILARLHEGGHIAVDPSSEPAAFEWDEYDRPESFDPLLVRWRLADVPLVSPDATPARVGLAASTDEDQAAVVRLCRAVLVQECSSSLSLFWTGTTCRSTRGAAPASCSTGSWRTLRRPDLQPDLAFRAAVGGLCGAGRDQPRAHRGYRGARDLAQSLVHAREGARAEAVPAGLGSSALAARRGGVRPPPRNRRRSRVPHAVADPAPPRL